ncbi:hypothetical protein N7468_002303 [Penicillium chermesinum]|uniref:Uncharacterized protein n=1 Tax=Penicillium chermesinum TaxID=63820 RepID=A0A9W9PID4_9EURO|nr:uncharacterized protein N7468_002303 [Penicillium chermesinum]KAJ5247320.1 hypothetical protein N7468_002303 [Penicillium chermesinum]KAJ6145564.1 hypothetical protein N7470_009459 [Penicillium chermesinum]
MADAPALEAALIELTQLGLSSWPAAAAYAPKWPSRPSITPMNFSKSTGRNGTLDHAGQALLGLGPTQPPSGTALRTFHAIGVAAANQTHR